MSRNVDILFARLVLFSVFWLLSSIFYFDLGWRLFNNRWQGLGEDNDTIRLMVEHLLQTLLLLLRLLCFQEINELMRVS